MQNHFNGSVSPLSEAEQALRSWGIEYKKQPDGTLFVPGNLDISSKGLRVLPGLSTVSVTGYFSCSDNLLTSLEGVPHTVGSGFHCSGNRLTSLEGAPQTVGGGFTCSGNRLTSLKGAPQSVTGNFYCDNDQLTSLKGAPHTIGGHFYCHHNQLTSLEHAPHTVTGDFYCDHNQLTSLEGAPKTFKNLKSDFGVFADWEAVPEELRLSPETRARQEKELQMEFSEAATVLKAPIKISSPLRLKK